MFHKEEDFEAFEQILFEALQMHKVELFSFQLMPNHTHLVPRPNPIHRARSSGPRRAVTRARAAWTG
ncbi:MAG: hypothetical protein R6U98_28720 [Pirellulaceae bacterium]